MLIFLLTAVEDIKLSFTCSFNCKAIHPYYIICVSISYHVHIAYILCW
jgi:hypothetical protein